MKNYPDKVLFDVKGIHLSIFLILIATIPFIVYSNKFGKPGHLYVLLGIYCLLFAYLLIVFARTYGPAFAFKKEVLIDNHRILGFTRKIRKEQIESVELKEKYTKRGLGRFIEVKKINKKNPILLLDDRINCNIDELMGYIEEWRAS